MKNNILNDLKEYREFLTEKFGFNNINVPNDNHHVSLDKVDNGINRYLRERLGNLILEENDVVDLGVKKEYFYTDYDKKSSYIGTFYKNNNVFILRENGSSTATYNRHYLVINENGIKYLKYNTTDKYLMIEELKYGKKVDICSITTKFYDSMVAYNFLGLRNNTLDYHFVDKINEENIVPEIEFVSKIYEDKTIEVSTKNDENIYEFLMDKLVFVNGVAQWEKPKDGFKIAKRLCFDKNESVDLAVTWHFDMLQENRELISECLGLDEEFKFENNSFVKKRRRF